MTGIHCCLTVNFVLTLEISSTPAHTQHIRSQDTLVAVLAKGAARIEPQPGSRDASKLCNHSPENGMSPSTNPVRALPGPASNLMKQMGPVSALTGSVPTYEPRFAPRRTHAVRGLLVSARQNPPPYKGTVNKSEVARRAYARVKAECAQAYRFSSRQCTSATAIPLRACWASINKLQYGRRTNHNIGDTHF